MHLNLQNHLLLTILDISHKANCLARNQVILSKVGLYVKIKALRPLYIVGILFLIFDLEILLIYPLAVTLYQVSIYGFWIFVIFLVVLTVGFVLEIGSGVLYFTPFFSI